MKMTKGFLGERFALFLTCIGLAGVLLVGLLAHAEAQSGTVSTYAGTGSPGFSGNNGPPRDAQLRCPTDVAVDPYGDLFIADHSNHQIRKVAVLNGVITITPAVGTGSGGFSGDNGPAASAQTFDPRGIVFDASGNMYFADESTHRIRRVAPGADGIITGAPDEIITTIAGTGAVASTGDFEPGLSAAVNPGRLALHPSGRFLYFTETGFPGGHRVRRIEITPPDYIVTPVAGTGVQGFAGDGGPPLAAMLDNPQGLTFDAAGNLFITDSNNHRIRRVAPGADVIISGASDEIITTVAGSGPVGEFTGGGFYGDEGRAIAALLNQPQDIKFDAEGNLYIADVRNHRIRMVAPGANKILTGERDEIITTAAGDGTPGFQDGPAAIARFNGPSGLAFDFGGDLFIADCNNHAIRRLSLDTVPPTIECDNPDGLWHAANVLIACTAEDTGAGLSNPDDAAFFLSTAVPEGNENANAATDSRIVCDALGNCATAGPIIGNMVDRRPPTVTINAPTSMVYTINQAVAADYACTDGGSGVAGCAGNVANGSNIDTGSIGGKTFVVVTHDNVANAASQSVHYTVAYGVCLAYDPTKAHKTGSTIPIKLQLCDVNGTNYSSAAVVVTAVRIALVSTNAPGTLEDAGHANPDNNFRFDPTLGGTGGYIYNLKTTGFGVGTYHLTFTAGSDPTTHTIQLQVK